MATQTKSTKVETVKTEESAPADEPQMWTCACGASVEASHKNYTKGWRLPKRVPTCPECIAKAKAK